MNPEGEEELIEKVMQSVNENNLLVKQQNDAEIEALRWSQWEQRKTGILILEQDSISR